MARLPNGIAVGVIHAPNYMTGKKRLFFDAVETLARRWRGGRALFGGDQCWDPAARWQSGGFSPLGICPWEYALGNMPLGVCPWEYEWVHHLLEARWVPRGPLRIGR